MKYEEAVGRMGTFNQEQGLTRWRTVTERSSAGSIPIAMVTPTPPPRRKKEERLCERERSASREVGEWVERR